MTALLLVWAMGCGGDPTPAAGEMPPLEDALLARRISFDLRGFPPSRSDLSALTAGDAGLDGLTADWIHQDAFEERLVHVFAEQYLTRLDTFEVRHDDYLLDDLEEHHFERSVGEEPLRLVAHIVAEDLPWTDVVTADYTMANGLLADLWHMDRPGPEAADDAWLPAQYTDGRPAAGVLATNGLWWRYVTNISNLNRSRAAAMSWLLTCHDLLTRPVRFSQDEGLAAAGGTDAAVRESPECVSCHAAVDPAAAALFGFWSPVQYSAIEYDRYHPEREGLWSRYLGVRPAWHGRPVDGLADLGVAIAEDPRFTRCAVQRFAEALWRRPVGPEDLTELDDVHTAFTEDRLRGRTAIVALLQTPEYRAAAAPDDHVAHPLRMLSPDQMALTLARLTGFTWTWDGFDQLANDEHGYRVLLGGVDGAAVTRPLDRPGLTWAVATWRLAEAAADHAVQSWVSGDPPPLFDGLDPDARPGEPGFDATILALHLQLFSVAPTAAERDALAALWQAMADASDPTSAWTGMLSAMLRDPSFLTY